MEEGGQQLLALWIGGDSQKAAHHFYSLQAGQFFDESEDPTYHSSLWNFKDKNMEEKHPRAIIFDTQSEHLTKIRKISHKKILKKMSEPNQHDNFFPFQFMPQNAKEEQQQENPNDYLYDNWQAGQQNYAIINHEYNELKVSYQLWQEFYNHQAETYEDKIRKYLQKTDFLRLFTICSDADRLGFTNKLIEHVKDTCPKRSIVFTSLSKKGQDKYYSDCFLPLVGKVAEEVTLLVDVDVHGPQFGYFQGDGFYQGLAPVLNSYYTPFILKNSRCDEYVYKIQQGSKNIFNMAYTLPVIDQELSLHQNTNIVEYYPQLNPKTGKILQKSPENINRVNIANNSFLNYVVQPKTTKNIKQKFEVDLVKNNKVIAQSFVLKGNFAEVGDKFKDKPNNFQIKYLKGILASNPRAKLQYNKFYQPFYGQTVQFYPFHTVLFQHTSFGPAIRNYTRMNQTNYSHNEMGQEWRENVMVQADYYQPIQNCDSD